MTIDLSNRSVSYTLKYSLKAKYLRLQIKNKGELEVVLPRGYNLSDAVNFIKKKSEWINKHLKKNEIYDNRYLFLGDEIKIEQNYDLFIKRHKLSFLKNVLSFTSPAGATETKEELYENWLKKTAKKSLVERVHNIAEKYHFQVGRISIRSQKTRWGSCSSKGNLSFNYNLLRFGKEIVDYVIIHELCHIKEMNHSEKFWKLVEKFCPDYRRYRKELKGHSI